MNPSSGPATLSSARTLKVAPGFTVFGATIETELSCATAGGGAIAIMQAVTTKAAQSRVIGATIDTQCQFTNKAGGAGPGPAPPPARGVRPVLPPLAGVPAPSLAPPRPWGYRRF